MAGRSLRDSAVDGTCEGHPAPLPTRVGLQSGLKYARVGEVAHAAQAEVAGASKESFWPAPRLPQSRRTWP